MDLTKLSDMHLFNCLRDRYTARASRAAHVEACRIALSGALNDFGVANDNYNAAVAELNNRTRGESDLMEQEVIVSEELRAIRLREPDKVESV